MIARNITVRNGPAGFYRTGSGPVLILDERGVPFYDTRYLAKNPTEFNLPTGQYTQVEGKFQQRVEPVKYELAPMPPKQRNKRKDPERFEVVFGDNPHKCTIDWDTEQIIFDHHLENLPLPCLIYILYHEFAHRWYGCRCSRKNCPECEIAEIACDRYAQNRMLETGYNPSQIGEAIVASLSDKNHGRKEIVVDSLMNDCDHLDYCDHSGKEWDSCGTYETINANKNGDCLEYNETPNPNWSCEDWVVWHKDLLRAYQDGRLAEYSKEKALEETNRVFAHHWAESAGFSKKFWGYCGYRSGFYDYFKSIGYTDHISFIAGVLTPVIGGSSDVAGSAVGAVKNVGNIVSGKAFLPLVLGLAAVVGYVVFIQK
ncbi:MAG: hypothetical protein M0R40_09755 [Firmicutes bacterium]|nr:hypothetical protein [Bacillota bacterium]